MGGKVYHTGGQGQNPAECRSNSSSYDANCRQITDYGLVFKQLSCMIRALNARDIPNMLRGSIVALVTPMADDGSVDYSALRELVRYHIANNTAGIVAVGTTGESATLTFDEHQQVIREVLDVAQGKIPVYAGNGTNSTAQSVERTKILDSLPVDGFMTVVPYYNKPSQQGMIAHFTAVAAATNKPVMLYNVPGRTVADLLPPTVAELARVDNIVGIKEATGIVERLRQIRELCPADFVCLSGDDETTLDFIAAGGDGCISVTANVAAFDMANMCHLALDGELAAAKVLDDKLRGLHCQLFCAPSPTPAKWALKTMGLIPNDNVRLPLTKLEPIHQNAVKQALIFAGLLPGNHSN